MLYAADKVFYLARPSFSVEKLQGRDPA